MKEPLWQRLRRQREESKAADDPVDAGGQVDGSTRPDEPERTRERDVLETLRLLNRTPEPSTDGASAEAEAARAASSNRQAAYADWADRMKQKRAEKQATIRATKPPEPGSSRDGTYWSSDALYEESRRLESDLTKAVQTRVELLAVLGLSGTATEDDVHRQYRTLAKEHHPDRFPDADESTRDWHAEQMHRINAAYRALQDVGA